MLIAKPHLPFSFIVRYGMWLNSSKQNIFIHVIDLVYKWTSWAFSAFVFHFPPCTGDIWYPEWPWKPYIDNRWASVSLHHWMTTEFPLPPHQWSVSSFWNFNCKDLGYVWNLYYIMYRQTYLFIQQLFTDCQVSVRYCTLQWHIMLAI